jgi:hypothetical protein
MVSARTYGRTVALDGAELEALLSAAVLRGHCPDAEGEQRAVAAFLAARDAGALRARTRRRDDWRPREQRRLALSLKTTLSLFLASLTLGGAAFAAIGPSGSSDAPAVDKSRPTPSTQAPDGPAAEPSTPGAAETKPGHPTTAQDTEAKCTAYDQVKDRGRVPDSTAWQRLVAAAGGEDKVAAYCAGQPARATADDKPGQAATPGSGAGEATRRAPGATKDVGDATKGVADATEGVADATSGAPAVPTDKAAGNKTLTPGKQ